MSCFQKNSIFLQNKKKMCEVFTKSTHFFLLIASRWLSPKKGVVWTNIDLSGFAVLLQFATTHQSGILARTLSRLTSLRNGFPGRRHRSNSNHFYLNSAVNQNGAIFSNFENSQKIEQKSYDDNFCGLLPPYGGEATMLSC